MVQLYQHCNYGLVSLFSSDIAAVSCFKWKGVLVLLAVAIMREDSFAI